MSRLVEASRPSGQRSYAPFAPRGVVPIAWLLHEPDDDDERNNAEAANNKNNNNNDRAGEDEWCAPPARPVPAREAPLAPPPPEPVHAQREGDGEGEGEGEEEEEDEDQDAHLPVCVVRADTGELACKACGLVDADELAVVAHAERCLRPHLCRWPECGKDHPNPSLLRVHVRVHTNERPFPCPHCRAAFTQSGDLVRHKRTHTGEKPFVCCKCGAAFCVSSTLKRHLMSHLDVRPHRCPYDRCSARFVQKYDLDRHITTHTGEKNFHCAVAGCGKAFSCSSGLAAHRRRMHKTQKVEGS